MSRVVGIEKLMREVSDFGDIGAQRRVGASKVAGAPRCRHLNNLAGSFVRRCKNWVADLG